MNKQIKKERLSKRLITPANFQETCRICFSQGNLYDTETSMYEGCTIAEIFRSLISEKELHIVESYARILYPQFICYSCIQNLIYTKLFLNQCYKAPKTLSKVYTHLTLHQHNSIIITKPSFLYQKANTAIMQRCKLSKISLKLTMELEKALLRRRNEVNVIKKNVDPNESMANVFEILADEENPEIKQIAKKTKEILNVEINRPNKKRKIDLRLDNNAKQTISLSTAKFVKILPTAIDKKADKNKKKKTVKKLVKTDKTLIVKNDKTSAEIDEKLLSKVYIKITPKALTELNEIKNLQQKEIDNTQVKEISKQKIRKSPRKKKIVSYNEQQNKSPTNEGFDCVNVKPIPNNWWCNSSNGEIYSEKVKKSKQVPDADPPDVLTKNNVVENDKLIEDSHVENAKKSEGLNKIANVSTCQNINITFKNNDCDVKSQNQADDSACQKQLDVRIDIKKEPIEQNENINKTDAEETTAQQKVDTGQIYRAIADINRDQRNIDLDHCYTNMNVYKNVRYILPRLNFKRTNDLLYPAPDVARKKDQVLAGNISKRMASILSGNLTEKIDENEVCFDNIQPVVKIESVEDNFGTDECYGYIKPEYVHVDEDLIFSEEQRFIRMIQEGRLHNDNEMNLCEVDPLLQSDNLNAGQNVYN